MKHVAEIQMRESRVSETEKLVARQVERIFIRRLAQLSCREAETRLSELCSTLATRRAKLIKTLAEVKSKRADEKLLRAGSDVGGPRWHIGWAALA